MRDYDGGQLLHKDGEKRGDTPKKEKERKKKKLANLFILRMLPMYIYLIICNLIDPEMVIADFLTCVLVKSYQETLVKPVEIHLSLWKKEMWLKRRH